MRDYVTVVDSLTGWCDLLMDYTYASNAGATDGQGVYLFTLPSGYKFDLAAHPADTSTNGSLTGAPYIQMPAPSVSAGSIYRMSDSALRVMTVVPHSATQFKLCAYADGYNYVGQSYFQLSYSGTGQSIKVQTRFKKG
jgi:hypothetical protein